MHGMRALVLAGEDSWISNGLTTIRQRRPAETADIGWILDNFAGPAWFQEAGEGVIVYDRLPVADAEVFVHRARASGWGTTNKGIEGLSRYGWVTFTKIGHPTVHVGMLNLMTQSRTPLFRLDESAAVIAHNLAQYHTATTVAWRGQAGMNAHALLRRCHAAKHQPLWYWRIPREAADTVGSTELKWSRPLAPAERQLELVAGWDIRAMYLAAAMNAEVSWSALEYTGPRASWEPGAAGYWRIQPPRLLGPPIVLPDRIRADGTAWVTSPVLHYYADHGALPEILDSYTAKRTGRYLREWASILRDALTQELRDDVRHAIKDTYARGVSMLTRQGGLIYRPDWRDEIVSRAMVNLRRKLDNAHKATGLNPVRVNVDEAMYACDKDQAIEIGHALGAAEGIGKFKPSRDWTIADYIERYGE